MSKARSDHSNAGVFARKETEEAESGTTCTSNSSEAYQSTYLVSSENVPATEDHQRITKLPQCLISCAPSSLGRVSTARRRGRHPHTCTLSLPSPLFDINAVMAVSGAERNRKYNERKHSGLGPARRGAPRMSTTSVDRATALATSSG